MPLVLKSTVLVAGALATALCLYPQTAPNKDVHSGEPQGIPPRAAPGDYQAHAQAGSVTVAAEFIGHFVPTSQGTLTTDDFVVVEAGLFGEPEARLKLSSEDFSLRINGRKMPLPSRPYGMVTGSLKDPDLEPPASSSSKPKTSIGGGGGQGDSDTPPAPVHIPIEVQRAMAQRVQKASLAEGDRSLPQAGLIFFPYKGKGKDIRSIELLYNGPAGQATLPLQP
jgi:hypothetical protein